VSSLVFAIISSLSSFISRTFGTFRRANAQDLLTVKRDFCVATRERKSKAPCAFPLRRDGEIRESNRQRARGELTKDPLKIDFHEKQRGEKLDPDWAGY